MTALLETIKYNRIDRFFFKLRSDSDRHELQKKNLAKIREDRSHEIPHLWKGKTEETGQLFKQKESNTPSAPP